MSNQTDSFDVIQQLRKNDIILDPVTNEKYAIGDIGDDYFILVLVSENRAFKMLRFFDLIKEKWTIERSGPMAENSENILIKD